ncbi:MAG: DNA primase [Bacillota bacterium]
MTPIEEIKSKLDIVEVVRDYIPLKAAGANFQANCPFHKEKSPSFNVSPERQMWHCFGCGKGGDVLSFVQEMEGLSFPDTLRLLAQRAGVVLKNDNPQERSRRSRLLDCLQAASAQYQSWLESESEGRKMKEYLLRRGLDEDTIREWQVGYAPESWNALMNGLKAKGFRDDEIMAAGLAARGERGSLYDRFRDRITFPIRDVNGSVIAFTARINPDKAEVTPGGKYINSPQTEAYDKSRVLFALDKAKKAIKERGFAIIVEGQMDAISCHQHGFQNAVASSGTALTTEQLRLLQRFTNNIALSFDMDQAGQLAADRGIAEAMALDINIKIIILPGQYKDPDDCLRANPADFKEALLNMKPMMEYYFDKVKAGKDLRKVADKKEVSRLMLIMISKLANKIEQDYWFQRLGEVVGISEQVLRESVIPAKERPLRAREEAEKPSAPLESLSREDRLAEIFLAMLLRTPEMINNAASHIEPEDLDGETYRTFYRNLIIYYNKYAVLEFDSFSLYLQEQDDGSAGLAGRLALLGEKDYYAYDPGQLKVELTKIIVELKRFSLKGRIKQLQDKIASAEAKGEGLDALMAELKNLADQLNALQF